MNTLRHSALALVLIFSAHACETDEDSPLYVDNPDWLVANPLGDFPAFINEVGLYPLPGEMNITHERAIQYTPRWPLWTNGSIKDRFIVLPAGETIHNSASSASWDMPPGTLLFKTFSYPSEKDMSQRVPIETRILRRTETEWEYAVYQWNEEGSDATLLPMKEPVIVALSGIDSPTETHAIPNRTQCRKCHESAVSEVLGFSELQLGDPLSEGADIQLTDLYGRGVFTQPPPEKPGIVTHDDPLTRDVLGYMQGNCIHCHNDTEGPSSSYSLHFADALNNLINVPTESSASAAGIRIVPGKPEESILFQALSGETENPEVKPMPPVGVQLLDTVAIEMFREWISAL